MSVTRPTTRPYHRRPTCKEDDRDSADAAQDGGRNELVPSTILARRFWSHPVRVNHLNVVEIRCPHHDGHVAVTIFFRLPVLASRPPSHHDHVVGPGQAYWLRGVVGNARHPGWVRPSLVPQHISTRDPGK